MTTTFTHALLAVILATPALALPATAQAAPATPTAATCPSVALFNPDLAVLHGYRIVTGPDRKAKAEPMTIAAKSVPLMKTGRTLNLFNLPTAPTRGVQIVAGPAGMSVPLHPAPYKEMFVILSGSTTLEVGDFKTELTPGMVLLADDADAVDGHGGTTGPCGYVAVSIAP